MCVDSGTGTALVPIRGAVSSLDACLRLARDAIGGGRVLNPLSTLIGLAWVG
jgi:hypothetical protein